MASRRRRAGPEQDRRAALPKQEGITPQRTMSYPEMDGRASGRRSACGTRLGLLGFSRVTLSAQTRSKDPNPKTRNNTQEPQTRKTSDVHKQSQPTQPPRRAKRSPPQLNPPRQGERSEATRGRGGGAPTSGVWGSPPRTKDERPMSALSADMGLSASRGAEGNRTPDLLDAN